MLYLKSIKTKVVFFFQIFGSFEAFLFPDSKEVSFEDKLRVLKRLNLQGIIKLETDFFYLTQPSLNQLVAKNKKYLRPEIQSSTVKQLAQSIIIGGLVLLTISIVPLPTFRGGALFGAMASNAGITNRSPARDAARRFGVTVRQSYLSRTFNSNMSATGQNKMQMRRTKSDANLGVSASTKALTEKAKGSS